MKKKAKIILWLAATYNIAFSNIYAINNCTTISECLQNVIERNNGLAAENERLVQGNLMLKQKIKELKNKFDRLECLVNDTACVAKIEKTISVSALNCCQPTGIMVSRGDLIKISAFGDWSLCEYSNQVCRCGPGGNSYASLPQQGAPIADLPLGTLIGSIGNGPFFGIGSSLNFVATIPGELKLGINDIYYADNSHSLIVIIKVVRGHDGL